MNFNKQIFKIFSTVIVVLLLFLSASFSISQNIFYNMLLLPILGALSFALLKKKSIFMFIFTFILFSFAYISISFADFTQDYFNIIAGSAGIALLHCGFFALGMLISFLIYFGIKKKKYVILKVLSFIFATILIGFIVIAGNSLLGNPISSHIAKNIAEDYMEETYPNTDFYIDSVAYDFKMGNYNARVRSNSSVDTAFLVAIDVLGNKVSYDTYERYVLSGSTIHLRLRQEYEAICREILQGYPIINQFNFNIDNERMGELVLDTEFDYTDISYKHGVVSAWLDETYTTEEICDILLNIKDSLDDEDIGFDTISIYFTNTDDSTRHNLKDFSYDDITKDGLLERVLLNIAENQ